MGEGAVGAGRQVAILSLEEVRLCVGGVSCFSCLSCGVSCLLVPCLGVLAMFIFLVARAAWMCLVLALLLSILLFLFCRPDLAARAAGRVFFVSVSSINAGGVSCQLYRACRYRDQDICIDRVFFEYEKAVVLDTSAVSNDHFQVLGIHDRGFRKQYRHKGFMARKSFPTHLS